MARMPYGIVYKNDLPDHWPNYSKFTHTPFGNYNYTLFYRKAIHYFNPKAVHYFIRKPYTIPYGIRATAHSRPGKILTIIANIYW